jgi:hypothetical protein
MEGYLGEQIIEIEALIPPTTWALHWLERYSQIDGEHHKAWVLDQVARILRGTPVIAKLASWENGAVEMRYSLGEPSEAYLSWVAAYEDGGEYSWDVGIAP